MPVFNALIRVAPVNSGLRYLPYFDILNRIGVIHECDRQTDRQTDILLANARPKTVHCTVYIGLLVESVSKTENFACSQD